MGGSGVVRPKDKRNQCIWIIEIPIFIGNAGFLETVDFGNTLGADAAGLLKYRSANRIYSRPVGTAFEHYS